jgi:hypothetical protein
VSILSAIISFLLLVSTYQSAPSEVINSDYLRRDEMFAYHEIAFQFSGSCTPLPDTRTLAMGLDRIRFLDKTGGALAVLDLGTAGSAYYLGEGWYGLETWEPDLTMCWSNALRAKSLVYFPIPGAATSLELTLTTACTPVSSQVFLDRQKIG